MAKPESDTDATAAGATTAETWLGTLPLAPDLPLLELPECETGDALPCNGACVGRDTEINGCLFIANATYTYDFAADAAGFYFANGVGQGKIQTVNEAQDGLVSLASTEEDSYLHLTLDGTFLYFAVSTDSGEQLWRAPRTGGESSLILPDIPTTNRIVVAGNYVFVHESLEPLLHRFTLDGGESTVFERSSWAMGADGVDLYFTDVQGPEGAQQTDLFRATAGDVDAAELVAEVVSGPIVGFDADWVYAATRRTSEEGDWIQRFAKDGSAEQPVHAVASTAAQVLHNGVLLFTASHTGVEYIVQAEPDGSNALVVGYLPMPSTRTQYLAADADYVYAAKGGVIARFRRP